MRPGPRTKVHLMLLLSAQRSVSLRHVARESGESERWASSVEATKPSMAPGVPKRTAPRPGASPP
eukprot:4452022-Prymnesium_polylepis.1